MARKIAASLVCLTFLVPAPSSAETDFRSALALFESRGVFRDSPGRPDPLRGLLYSGSEGKLTAIGELLYRGLSGEAAQPAPDGAQPAPAAAALAELDEAVSRRDLGAASRSALLGARFDGGAAIPEDGPAVEASGAARARAYAASNPAGRRDRALEARIEALERGLEQDRLLRVAELLGERGTEDELLRRADRPLDDLPFRRRRVYDAACGGYVGTVLELVDCGLAGRRAELEAARRAARTDGRAAARHAALAVAEALRFHAAGSLERLGYEPSGSVVRPLAGGGPEAGRLREALESAPFTAERRERYRGRAADLALRLGRILSRVAESEGGLRTVRDGEEAGLLASLDAAREELEQAVLDVSLFLSLPALAGAAASQGRGLTAGATRSGALLANRASRLLGGGWFGGYLEDRGELGRCGAALSDAAARLADGDFEAAREGLAALARIQGPLGRVAEVHAYSGIVVHWAAWSLALAAAAPAAGFLLSGAAEGCFAAARGAAGAAEAVRAAGLVRTAAALRTAAFVPRASGLILEHTALRLAALGAAADGGGSAAAALRARLASSAAGLGSFSLLACGGMSGAASAAVYAAGRSSAEGPWQALRRGYLDGAGWAVGSRGQWWTPLVLFVGVPSRVWAGTPAAGAAEELASRGLVGGTLSAARRVPGLDWLGSPGLEAWAGRGGWRAGVGAALGAGDQLAKYAAVSRGAGASAEALRYRLDGAAGVEPEARIRRARASGEAHEALPYWLLLPVHPAARVAAVPPSWSAAEGAEPPLLRAPRRPVSLRLFDAGLDAGPPAARTKRVRGGPVDQVFGRMRADMSPIADSSVRAGLGVRPLPEGWGPERVVLTLRRRLDVLTRVYARELLSACWRDSSLPAGARWALFWRVLPSVVFPRGSWVEARLLDAASACGRTPRKLS